MTLVEAFFAAFAIISLRDFAEGIVAGTFAKDGDYPYSVVILRNGDVLCGGVLVTSKHVFTSCHCVGKFGRIEDVTDINWEPLETAYTINYTFDDLSIHKRYGRSTLKLNVNDIGHSTQERINNTLNLTHEPSSNDMLKPTQELFSNNTLEPTQELSINDTLVSTQELSSIYDTLEPTQEASTNNTTTTDFPTALSSALEITNNINENTTIHDEREFTKVKIIKSTNFKFGMGQVRRPLDSYQHPSCYNDTMPWEFDYGVYACRKFKFNVYLAPMELWHQDRVIMTKRFNKMINDGEICVTVGWGATLQPGESGKWNNSEKLKWTKVKLVTDTLCNELLCRQSNSLCQGLDFQWSDRGIVCATHLSVGDSCNGDDGNALVCDNHVVGFTNTGIGCLKNFPSENEFRVFPRRLLDFSSGRIYKSTSKSSKPSAEDF